MKLEEIKESATENIQEVITRNRSKDMKTTTTNYMSKTT
jgi:hypothetical protein